MFEAHLNGSSGVERMRKSAEIAEYLQMEYPGEDPHYRPWEPPAPKPKGPHRPGGGWLTRLFGRARGI